MSSPILNSFSLVIKNANARFWCVGVSIFCILSFFSALGIQHLMNLEPCPLCIFQRVAILSVAFFAAAAWIFDGRWPKASRLFLALAIVSAAAGLALAARHMYVMWVPQEASCGPDLEYLMESFPPSKWLPKVFSGEAECAAAGKHLLLWLPIPVWAALGFAACIAGLVRGCFKLGLNKA